MDSFLNLYSYSIKFLELTSTNIVILDITIKKVNINNKSYDKISK